MVMERGELYTMVSGIRKQYIIINDFEFKCQCSNILYPGKEVKSIYEPRYKHHIKCKKCKNDFLIFFRDKYIFVYKDNHTLENLMIKRTYLTW